MNSRSSSGDSPFSWRCQLLRILWLVSLFCHSVIRTTLTDALAENTKQNGGDCIQNIKESILKDLEPKILYESKDTQRFDEKWVRKLADDMELSKAAKGVIITKALPKDFKAGCVTRLNNKIWIIPFKKETIILTATSLILAVLSVVMYPVIKRLMHGIK